MAAGISAAWPLATLEAVRNSYARWRDQRRLRIVRQMERNDCAAACLAMLLRYHGCAAPLAQVRAQCGSGRDGATAAAIGRAARAFHCTPSALRLTTVQLSALASLPLPMIAHVDGDHFVVLARVSGQQLIVLDPDQGRQAWTESDAARRLTGVLIQCTPNSDFVKQRAVQRSLRAYGADLSRCTGALAWVALCTLLLEIVALGLPAATQVLVDHVIAPQRAEWLWPLAAGLLAAGATQIALIFARDRVIHLLHVTLDVVLITRFVAHLLHLPLQALAQRTVGDLMQRVQANIELRDMSTRLIMALLDGALLFAYGALMLAYHWGLALLILSLHVTRLALTQVGRAAQRDAIGQTLAAQGRESAAALEALSAPELVRAFGLGPLLHARFCARSAERANASLERSRLSQRNARLVQTFDGLSQAVVLGACGAAVLAEQLTLGQFAGFIALSALLGRPLQALSGLAGQWSLLRATLERVDDILRIAPAPNGTRACAPLRGEVALNGVWFRYGCNGRDVLQDVTLRITAGDKVAIVGASGAGKSTLAQIILGLEQPTRGEVFIDQQALATLDQEALRSQVGAVLQAPFIFNDSARANLSLAHEDVASAPLRDACQVAQIDAVLEALPQGLDSTLGPAGQRLSGGQRQRLAVARALVGGAPLLVLDEATSHLDAATEQRLHAALTQRRGTQIIIAHRLATVRNVDRIIVLEQGRIVQQGHFATLSQQAGPFRRLLEAGDQLC